MDAGYEPPIIPWHITRAAFAAARKPTGWDDEDRRVVRAFWEAYAHAEDQLRQEMT